MHILTVSTKDGINIIASDAPDFLEQCEAIFDESLADEKLATSAQDNTVQNKEPIVIGGNELLLTMSGVRANDIPECSAHLKSMLENLQYKPLEYVELSHIVDESPDEGIPEMRRLGLWVRGENGALISIQNYFGNPEGRLLLQYTESSQILEYIKLQVEDDVDDFNTESPENQSVF